MFNQRDSHHPPKSTTPNSPPACFGFAGYIGRMRFFNVQEGFNCPDARSPDPSPLHSPVRGPRPLVEEASTILHIPGRFPKPDRPQPTRPPMPTPDEPRENSDHNNTFTQTPPPKPSRRKASRGPKHLSFTKTRNDSGTTPHHRHAQKTKEKSSAVHQRFRERRRVARLCRLSSLRREAQGLMQPEHMSDEDRIFLQQVQELELNENMTESLEQCREQMERAADEAYERQTEHMMRDKEAAKLWGGRHDEEAIEEQRRKVEQFVQADEEMRAAQFREMEEEALRADEERQRAHEAQERQLREEQERMFREELVRKAKEDKRRRREEERRQKREAEERQQREDRRRRMEEQLREFQRREEAFAQFLREIKERRAREDRERERERIERERIAREERERQARLHAAAEKAEQEQRYFLAYEGKWNELRTNDALTLIEVWDMPWPVFGVVSSAEQITCEEVQRFLFHPQRPGVEGKSLRDKVKAEVLRFHPDKFNTRILPKIQPSQQGTAQAIAGAVARILTSIMGETEQQN